MNQQGPASTVRIRHVHLQVDDLDRSTAFYRDLLGFRVVVPGPAVGVQASFLATGDHRHQIELHSAGRHLFTLLYLDRPELAQVVGRLVRQAYPIDNVHHAHDALSVHVTDPDGHGIELSYDRPRFDANKRLIRKTSPFDIRGLLIDATVDVLDLYNVAAQALNYGPAIQVAGRC
jgi:catechol 2,3-dioxygenase